MSSNNVDAADVPLMTDIEIQVLPFATTCSKLSQFFRVDSSLDKEKQQQELYKVLDCYQDVFA
jgi:hypothetical protein